MDKKDLFKAMNYIDADLVEEAMVSDEAQIENKKKNRKIIKYVHSIGAIAAVLAVVLLGHQVISLNNKIKNIEQATANHVSSSSDENKLQQSSVGVSDGKDIGDMFVVAKGYGDLYDHLEKPDKQSVINDFFGGGALEENSASGEKESADMSDMGTGSAMEYSKTNVMTEGVDESDIVKTDGNYIYMVESGRVSITDISKGEPGEKTILAPDFASPSDIIKEMYVADGNLLLITSHVLEDTFSDRYNDYADFWYGGFDEEIICYSYDIKDPTNPKLIGQMKQDGSYKTSRKIGDTVYLFSDKVINRPDEKREVSIAENMLKEWIPMINDLPVDYGCIFYGKDGQNGTLISSFDVKSPDKSIDAKYIMNGYSNVYVSADSIYFYRESWSKYSGRCITNISRLGFDDGIITAGESTSINGQIRDSFAISQQKNHLFVIATEDDSRTEVNTLHVFDKDMNETGRINEIARGELVYAARFIGDYVYFITYKQVDPLFVADISDPANPKLIGELEVEGFSEYLHIWDDTHVLGIGFMTEKNARAGIKLTMFDVSNPANPKEENYLVLKDEEYCAALEGEYKALLADPSKNLIGFASEGYSKKAGDYLLSYNLLNYDKKDGFSMIKTTNLKYTDTSGYRGLYIGDNFYIAGNGLIEYFSLQK